ncbi:MAG: hypothetical protein HDKAJFGB_04042 [Anaerolineae bacterium]|nr:hypothetical protein [Anaerolineae bacterium]
MRRASTTFCHRARFALARRTVCGGARFGGGARRARHQRFKRLYHLREARRALARRVFVQSFVRRQFMHARPTFGPLFRLDLLTERVFNFKQVRVKQLQQARIGRGVGFAMQPDFERVNFAAAHPHLVMNPALLIKQLNQRVPSPGAKIAPPRRQLFLRLVRYAVEKFVDAHELLGGFGRRNGRSGFLVVVIVFPADNPHAQTG